MAKENTERKEAGQETSGVGWRTRTQREKKRAAEGRSGASGFGEREQKNRNTERRGVSCGLYRGTSLIRNTHHPRFTIGP